MAETILEGDVVQITTRPATVEDAKSGIYYSYFAGLTGKVQKVFATQEAAVDVDLATLPEAVARRHNDIQEQMKKKWMDGLSEEARNRLSPAESELRLHYTLLVGLGDLSAVHNSRTPAQSVTKAAGTRSETRLEEPNEAFRATEKDLDAKEEAYLQSRKEKS